MKVTSIANSYFLAAFCALAFAISPARAALAPMTFTPNPADLNDLDHHSLYTWRIDNINLNNVQVTGASLTFKNIANWDANPNVLHIHLLDTAINAGVASFIDDPTGSAPVTDMIDDFSNGRFHNQPGWLVAAGTLDLFLKDVSFTQVGSDYVLNFTASQLTTLRQYIANGHNIAFGLDPDCHFFNDGIVFTMNIVPIPEVASLLPVALLVAVATGFEVRRRRRAAI
jgi:hypothetical protein